jgi:hypothetical protein
VGGAPARAIKVVVVIFIAIVAYRLIKRPHRPAAQREIEEEDPLVRRLREQRARRSPACSATSPPSPSSSWRLTILDILLENIGPILASFGIIGLAFSFGAQSLVKDVISGTFMLIEGQFGVGDVVKVSDVSGMVEKITLRTTVLRDVEGAVHIVPNGEITRVTNMTKAWSRAVLHIGVAYREDVDHVMDVLRDLLPSSTPTRVGRAAPRGARRARRRELRRLRRRHPRHGQDAAAQAVGRRPRAAPPHQEALRRRASRSRSRT